MTRLVLGIDGGGTKTVALLTDDHGNRLGRGQSGPSNVLSVGREKAAQHLDLSIAEAFRQSALPRQPVDSACLALAGMGQPAQRKWVEAWAAQRQLAVRCTVVHDARAVLAAGTTRGWGVALIAGTGSFAFGRTADGVEQRVGGWGPVMGDEGSGLAIALAGFRAVARASDGRGASTCLVERFLHDAGVSDAALLPGLLREHALDRSWMAQYARTVMACADERDAVAQSILHDACLALAEMLDTLLEKLSLPSRYELAVAGGVLCHRPDMRSLLVQKARHRPPAEPHVVADPVSGAVALAVQELV